MSILEINKNDANKFTERRTGKGAQKNKDIITGCLDGSGFEVKFGIVDKFSYRLRSNTFYNQKMLLFHSVK